LSHSLAIVIPAYKGKFLSATLQALADQTLQKFRVYIADDASPDDISSIVETFTTKLPITYKRFEDNLGTIDLTRHWERSINMLKDEGWIWLLPDDDVPSEDCVQVFFNEVGNSPLKEKLYRFQTVHIDEFGEVFFKPPLCPSVESNIEFLIKKLKFERSSSIAEYIFSRKQYEKVGGFVSLPLAWGSDDLLWIKLAEGNSIITLPAGMVKLRQSGINISSSKDKYTDIKFDAKYKFLNLIQGNKLFMDKVKDEIGLPKFRKIVSDHLFYEYKSHGLKFSNKRLLTYARYNCQVIGSGLLKNIYRLINYRWKIQ
jgi:glycosyltransferase involved in cell wall biosynthesis